MRNRFLTQFYVGHSGATLFLKVISRVAGPRTVGNHSGNRIAEVESELILSIDLTFCMLSQDGRAATHQHAFDEGTVDES